jgi:hypothetical protein
MMLLKMLIVVLVMVVQEIGVVVGRESRDEYLLCCTRIEANRDKLSFPFLGLIWMFLCMRQHS